jgi:hypothetical protein
VTNRLFNRVGGCTIGALLLIYPLLALAAALFLVSLMGWQRARSQAH